MDRTTFRGNKGFTISELLFVLLIALIVAGLMMPLIRHSRIRNERILCANNLREIGLGLYIYAKEHEGAFPPALKALYDEQYLADERVMDCPATRSTGTPASPDYMYVPGLTVKDPSLLALAGDNTDSHGHNGRNVLYVNGAVGWKE